MMKKVSILMGYMLAFPALASTEVTLNDNSNPICGDEDSSTCYIPGSGNTVTLDTDKYTAVSGGYLNITTGETSEQITVKDNTVNVLVNTSTDVTGSYVESNRNNNVDIQGTVNVGDGVTITGSVIGAQFINSFDDKITDKHDQIVNLSGAVVFDNSSAKLNLNDGKGINGSDLTYYNRKLTKFDKSLDVTQSGNVTIKNDSNINGGEIYGTRTDFNAQNTDYETQLGKGQYFNIVGGVDVDDSSITNIYKLSGANVYTQVSQNSQANFDVTGTVNINNSSFASSDEYDDGGISGAVIYTGTGYGDNLDIHHNFTVTGHVNVNNSHISANMYGLLVLGNDSTAGRLSNEYYQGNVTISGDSSIDSENSSIYGVYIIGQYAYSDYISKNTFTMSSSPLRVTTLANFGTYNFSLNEHNLHVLDDSNSSLIEVTERFGNDIYLINNELDGDPNNTNNQDATDVTYVKSKSKVLITGISGDVDLSKEHVVNLITIAGGDVAYTATNNDVPYPVTDDEIDGSSSLNEMVETENNTVTVDVGLVREADVDYYISDDGNSVVAHINKAVIDDEKVDSVLKSLGEGHVAALNNVLRGTDTLASVISDTHKEAGTFTPIAVINGGKNEYKESVKINSTDYRFMVGSRYQFADNLFAGIVLERGQSNYNATEGDVSGSGHTYNYGISLFSKYSEFFDKDEAYVESAIGYGHSSTQYSSNNLITGGGVHAHHKSKANYLNGQLAIGYVHNLDNYGFDSSARYLYTHLNKDAVVIEGDYVKFNSTNSSRVQLKEKVNFYQSNDITFSLAGIYEYEMGGKLDGSIDGVSAKSQSLQGSTGIMELGIKATPIQDKNFNLDLVLTGYSGKRKGVSSSLIVKYDF